MITTKIPDTAENSYRSIDVRMVNLYRFRDGFVAAFRTNAAIAAYYYSSGKITSPRLGMVRRTHQRGLEEYRRRPVIFKLGQRTPATVIDVVTAEESTIGDPEEIRKLHPYFNWPYARHHNTLVLTELDRHEDDRGPSALDLLRPGDLEHPQDELPRNEVIYGTFSGDSLRWSTLVLDGDIRATAIAESGLTIAAIIQNAADFSIVEWDL